MRNIDKIINDYFDEFVAIRRDFHMYPELSGKELRTSKKICDYLKDWDIEYYNNIAETGVVGIVKGKKPGKTVGIRADIDALPIEEDGDKDYKSKNKGVMHACGHDVHTTILLGTAKILKKMENKLNGNVKFFFQPAEESKGGAKRMVNQGCMDDPKVDYMLGLHVMPYIDSGVVEIKYGQLNAATGTFSIEVFGKSGHGAYPDKSVDAINIAGNIIVSLQSIISRNTSPLESVVLSLGKISGGTKNNIICDNVKMSGTFRTLDRKIRRQTEDKINNLVTRTAEAHGGEAKVKFKEGYAELINDDKIVDVIKDNAIKLLGKDNVKYKLDPSLGGEDFSYFLEDAEGAFFHLGCGSQKKKINAPLHNKRFDVDESCIKHGVHLQILNVMSLLSKE